jgi:hypothetical protein
MPRVDEGGEAAGRPVLAGGKRATWRDAGLLTSFKEM